VTGTLALLLAFLCSTASFGAEEKTGWSDTAEFSYVMTSGNSESSTLGFKNTALRKWTNALFTLNAGGIRVETTTITRDEDTSGMLDITETTEPTAEAYYLNGRYDRNITERLFWYAGAGWDRNTFAGIENRYVVEGGLGNVWFDQEDHKFRTLYGLTFTDQEDVDPDPTVDDSFVGAKFSWSYLNQFGSNTTYENVFALDLNLDETDDWRGNMINSIAVAMSERLALKVSHQILYDNMPSLVSVGTTPLLVELDDTDTIFTASLVVNF
jgi:putative salt-induced outer membrane protein